MPHPSDPPPEYTKYRSGPSFLRRGPRPGEPLLDDFRGAPGTPPPPDGPDEDGRRDDGQPRRPRLPGLPRRRRTGAPRGPISFGRIVKWVVLGAIAWVGLSLVLFLISAQIQQGDLSGKVALGGAGFPLTSPNTVLVLGSDQRPKGSKEAGADPSGPSRSDSIMLMRVGGGKNSRLSIPRDTIVDIPGHGRNKINAAYAFGGPALAVETIENYLGIKVNHLIEVNFQNFPDLIDAMGGITYEGGCVVSKINGGFKNGGYTLRLKKGKTHIDGKQALALARTRHNDCNKAESDLTRARRQQKILSAMKSRLISPWAFPRLPLIAWNTPKALKSDMSGPTLLGLFGALATSGSPPTRILKPDGAETAPDGGAGLHVSDAEKARDVERFLKG
ncbi:Polyisoprenyl-teichoic acid--peptidoglycan teichoic acid transferase TagU [Baekduia alba]|uniref:LCP family protein n=1 Tax=Baekduia alba TaxID=2997333 RepID=UPI0023418216|nr:LCP family protein [Baekduia alba]WCB92376.1 Polyisoprenyl-teichoic acid--peptidoglycan teichoic acid transferase TagU [Baekduia alba]